MSRADEDHLFVAVSKILVVPTSRGKTPFAADSVLCREMFIREVFFGECVATPFVARIGRVPSGK
jgi:hypothetical protein